MYITIVVVVISSIYILYYVLLKKIKKYLSKQKIYGYKIIKEYEGIRLVSQGFVSLSNYKEFIKHYYKTSNMHYVAFMLEIFCFNVRIVNFLIIEIIVLFVTIAVKIIYIKGGVCMSILFIVIFLLVLFYLLYYRRNEEYIDLNNGKFLQYLKDHNDDKTLHEIQNKLLSIDKADILIEKFYENDDVNYLAFAIQNFVIKGYFYTIILSVISLVFTLLLFILLYNVFQL